MTELEQVLEELKKLGKITDDDIRRVSWASKSRKEVVNTLHLLLCTKNHDTDCTYMSEEIYDDCWRMPAHQQWLIEAETICKNLLLEEPSKALTAIRAAMDIVRGHRVQSIYLALSALHPELLEALPLKLFEDKLLPALAMGGVLALPPDQAIDDDHPDASADNQESE